jgi:hypothetical protein
VWLGVGVGDDVIVTLADFRSTPMGGVQTMKRFKVSGVFEAGYNEFDKGLAVVNLQDLQRLLRMGEGVTGVRLKLHDMDQAFDVARDLALKLQGSVPGQRLDPGQRQPVPRAEDGEDGDGDPAVADHRDGRVQPGVVAGDAGHRQAGRHRHPAHARPDPAAGDAGVHGAGQPDRHHRHRARA